MAFDISSFFTGWEHRAGRSKPHIKVTTKGGDATQSGSDPQGTAWAPVMALTDGTADAGALGSSANPLVTGGRNYNLAGAPGAGVILAATTAAAAVSNINRGTYLIDITGTFNAGASLTLQVLASDNVTWRTLQSGIVAAGLLANTFQLAGNATVRVDNVGSASVTGLVVTMG